MCMCNCFLLLQSLFFSTTLLWARDFPVVAGTTPTSMLTLLSFSSMTYTIYHQWTWKLDLFETYSQNKVHNIELTSLFDIFRHLRDILDLRDQHQLTPRLPQCGECQNLGLLQCHILVVLFLLRCSMLEENGASPCPSIWYKHERLNQITFSNMLKNSWIVEIHENAGITVVSGLFFRKDPNWPRDPKRYYTLLQQYIITYHVKFNPIESHRVIQVIRGLQHTRGSFLGAPNGAGRLCSHLKDRDGMVNWSQLISKFMESGPICPGSSCRFVQTEKLPKFLPKFCPATYLVKVPEGSCSSSKAGQSREIPMQFAAQAAPTERRTVLKSTGPSHGSTPPTKRAPSKELQWIAHFNQWSTFLS